MNAQSLATPAAAAAPGGSARPGIVRRAGGRHGVVAPGLAGTCAALHLRAPGAGVLLATLLWGLVLVVAPGAARAQAPAAEGKTLSLGGGKATGRLLTRDELRACMQQQASLNTRRDQLDNDKKTLDADRAALMQEQETLKGERAKIDQQGAKVGEFNQRMREHSEKVKDWNERFKDFMDSGRSGPVAERQKAALEREKKELQAAQQDLDQLRAAIGSTEVLVKSYNERAGALDKRAATWNERNVKLVEVAQSLQNERVTWQGDCGDRRYREDDEIAIKRGQ